MHISIRYLGISVYSNKLEDSKEYRIGRAPDNDIVVNVSMMSRYQGKVYCEGGSWFYASFKDGQYVGKVQLQVMQPIDMRDQLEILISTGKVDEVTKGTSIDRIRLALAASQRKVNNLAYGALSLVSVVILAGVGGYQLYQSRQPMNAKTLLPHVRSKVVEFETPEKAKMVDDLRKYAKFEDKDFSDALGFCTGFLVGKNIVLTANHCLQGSGIVEPSYNYVIKTHDKKAHKIKRILGFDTKKDFAYIEMEGMESYGYLEFAKEYSLGDKVFTVGNAHGQGVAIREGILANETPDRNDPNIKFLRYSAAASPGNSGGPLLDAYGRIVSLVFAKTNAGENYNLGTRTDDLKAGYKTFVDNREPKKVKVKTSDMLVFSPQSLLYTLNLPSQESWYENPEYTEPLNKIEFEISVPATPESFFDESVVSANAATTKVYEEILAMMKKNNEETQSWESWASSGAKILYPSQYQPSYQKEQFKTDLTQILDSSGFIQPPSSWGMDAFKEGLKEGRYYFRTQEIFGKIVALSSEEKAKLRSDLSSGDMYFSLGDRKEKKNIANYAYRAGFESTKYYKNDVADWDEKRIFPSQLFIDSITGEKGAIADSSSVYVRPNAYKSFTVKKLEEEVAETSIKDRLGRTWNIKKIDVFNNSIESYCLPMIQGAACFVKGIANNHPKLMAVSRQNFADYSLSNYLARPEFASVEATLDYFTKGYANTNPMLKDFSINKSANGGLEVALNTIGVKFNFNKNEVPTSIRLNGAYHVAKKQWIAYGFEMIKPSGDSAKICGAGASLKGSPAQSVISEEDSRLQLYRKYDVNAKANYYAENFKSKNLNEDYKAYGYCWSLTDIAIDKENDMKTAAIDKLKPMVVDFEAIGSKALAH